MRTLLLIPALLLCTLSSARAQEVADGYWVAMDFARANTDAPISTEREVWMPFWQAMTDAGYRTSWSMYQVWYGFEGREYTYVWVHTARSLSDFDVPTAVWDSLWTVAHPGKDVDSLRAAWSGRFEFVKSELFRVQAAVGDWHGDMLSLGFMETPAGGGAEYLAVEREIWQPLMAESVNDGTRNGWSVLSLSWPGGSTYPYGYVAVNSFPRFERLDGSIPMMDYARRAHPDADLDAYFDRTTASRDIVRSELWYRALHVH